MYKKESSVSYDLQQRTVWCWTDDEWPILQFNAFSIKLNAQHANGITPLDLTENWQNELNYKSECLTVYYTGKVWISYTLKKGNFYCKIFGFPWFSWKIKAYPSTQKGYPLYSKKSLKSSIGLNGISTAKEDGFFRRLPPEISRQNEESDAFGRRRSRRRRSVAGSTSFGVEEERSKLGHRR